MKIMQDCRNKLVELLSVLGEVWWFFSFCKVEHTWWKARATRKDKEEEKMEERLKEESHGASFDIKRSSSCLFYVMKVCEFKKFAKKNPLNFF
jgi:hypothetical protein